MQKKDKKEFKKLMIIQFMLRGTLTSTFNSISDTEW